MLNRGLIIVVSILWGLGAYAQDSTSLDLTGVRVRAIKYNSQMQKAGLSLQESQKMLWEAISQGLPQVNASVDYQNFLGAEMSFAGQTMKFKPSSSASAQVSQLLFSGNYLVGVQIAKLYENLSQTQTKKTELDVVEQVSNSYYAILVSEKSIAILRKNLDNVKDLYKRTESLAKVGVVEETEVLQLSIQVSNLENALKSAARQLEMAYNILRLQLGIKMESPLQVVGDIDDVANSVNLDALLAQKFDINSNLDFQLVEGQSAVKEKQILLQKMSYLPTISGFYTFNAKLIKPEFDMTPKNVVGLKANIPIFASGQRKAAVDRAKLQHESALVDRNLLVDNLYIQSKQLKNNMQTYYEQYQTQKKSVDISKLVYNKFASKFEQGMVSSIDLNTSNNNYLAAESNLLSSMLNLLKAKSEFERLYGTK